MTVTISAKVECDDCGTILLIEDTFKARNAWLAAMAMGWRRILTPPEHDKCPACYDKHLHPDKQLTMEGT